MTRKSADATLRHCADADDIMYMMATLDVNKVPLPRFVAEDLDRIPAMAPPLGDRLVVAVGLMGSEDPADSAF